MKQLANARQEHRDAEPSVRSPRDSQHLCDRERTDDVGTVHAHEYWTFEDLVVRDAIGGYVDALVGRHIDRGVEASTHRGSAVLADAAVTVEEEEWSRRGVHVFLAEDWIRSMPWCDVALRTRGNQCVECAQRWWQTSGVRRWSRPSAGGRWTSPGSRPRPNLQPHRRWLDRGRRGSRLDQGFFVPVPRRPMSRRGIRIPLPGWRRWLPTRGPRVRANGPSRCCHACSPWGRRGRSSAQQAQGE